jgi:hypothetical protein
MLSFGTVTSFARKIRQAGVRLERYWQAFHAGEPERTGVFMGEAVGLNQDAPPVARIIQCIIARLSAS